MLTFDGTIVVPMADPDDGERTAEDLVPRLGSDATVVVVHVVQKREGSIDPVPAAQREEYAESIFERVRGVLAETDATVETAVLFAPDIVEAIYDEAEQRNADAVVFTPRRGTVLTELLTGGVARRLIKRASMPAIALPVEE